MRLFFVPEKCFNLMEESKLFVFGEIWLLPHAFNLIRLILICSCLLDLLPGSRVSAPELALGADFSGHSKFRPANHYDF